MKIVREGLRAPGIAERLAKARQIAEEHLKHTEPRGAYEIRNAGAAKAGRAFEINSTTRGGPVLRIEVGRRGKPKITTAVKDSWLARELAELYKWNGKFKRLPGVRLVEKDRI